MDYVSDPRWTEVSACIEVARVSRDIDRFHSCMRLVQAIADDPLALEEDREMAREILGDVAIRCRAQVLGCIPALVCLAEDEEAEIREAAKRMLRVVTERLPAASDKLQ